MPHLRRSRLYATFRGGRDVVSTTDSHVFHEELRWQRQHERMQTHTRSTRGQGLAVRASPDKDHCPLFQSDNFSVDQHVSE